MNQSFICNICATENTGDIASFTREPGFCRKCKSTVRMRSAILGLSIGLFGRGYSIRAFPRDREVTGVGLGDWEGYSKRLAKAVRYKNTFFDRSPRLDITKVVDVRGQYQLMSSSTFRRPSHLLSRARQTC